MEEIAIIILKPDDLTKILLWTRYLSSVRNQMKLWMNRPVIEYTTVAIPSVSITARVTTITLVLTAVRMFTTSGHTSLILWWKLSPSTVVIVMRPLTKDLYVFLPALKDWAGKNSELGKSFFAQLMRHTRIIKTVYRLDVDKNENLGFDGRHSFPTNYCTKRFVTAYVD